MKKLEIMFAKVAKILGPGNQVVLFAKQTIIIDDTDKLNVSVPEGYAIVSVTEILPDVNQCKKRNEKAIQN
jgi:hypothetical protein